MKSLIVSAMQRAVIAVPLLTAEHFHPGQNTITIRGEHQDIYFYPTVESSAQACYFSPETAAGGDLL